MVGVPHRPLLPSLPKSPLVPIAVVVSEECDVPARARPPRPGRRGAVLGVHADGGQRVGRLRLGVLRLRRASRVGSRVSSFGFRDSGFGFRVSGLGFRVSGFGCMRVYEDLGFMGVGDRVWGLGFGVEG